MEFALGLSLVGYLFLVRLVRYQRARSLERKYAPAGREGFPSMTANDAQAILKILADLEFPKLYGFSMVVALFRVCSPDHTTFSARH